MNIPQELDPTSPVVQRVFRLRERLVQDDEHFEANISRPGPYSLPADIPHREESYPWQMWQKSDFFAYSGDEFAHRCQAQTGTSLQVK